MSADDIDFATAAPPNGPPHNTEVATGLPLVTTRHRRSTGPGFDPTSGYGRINAARLVRWISSGRIPPQAEIDGVPWYQVLSPAQEVTVAGVIGDDPEPLLALRGAGRSRPVAGPVSVAGGGRRHRARGALGGAGQDPLARVAALFPPSVKLDGSPVAANRAARPRPVHVHHPGGRRGRRRDGRHGATHRIPAPGRQPRARGADAFAQLDRGPPGARPPGAGRVRRPPGGHGRRNGPRLRRRREGPPGLARPHHRRHGLPLRRSGLPVEGGAGGAPGGDHRWCGRRGSGRHVGTRARRGRHRSLGTGLGLGLRGEAPARLRRSGPTPPSRTGG